jgi:hypothetical protein
MSRIRKLAVAALVTGPLLAGTLVYSNLAGAAGPFGEDTCLYGYVWREAGPDDRICVTGDGRAQTQADNAVHDSRVVPGGGPYGANTCQPGFVWREAFAFDQVCVTPENRERAANQNQLHSSRRALDAFHARQDGVGDQIYGHAELWLAASGATTYRVHMNNSFAAGRNVKMQCKVGMLVGDPLVFTVEAFISGKIAFWEDSSKDWDQNVFRADVQERWAQIPHDAAMTCRVRF